MHALQAAVSIKAELRDDTARRIADFRASDVGCERVRSFLSMAKPSWLTS